MKCTHAHNAHARQKFAYARCTHFAQTLALPVQLYTLCARASMAMLAVRPGPRRSLSQRTHLHRSASQTCYGAWCSSDTHLQAAPCPLPAPFPILGRPPQLLPSPRSSPLRQSGLVCAPKAPSVIKEIQRRMMALENRKQVVFSRESHLQLGARVLYSIREASEASSDLGLNVIRLTSESARQQRGGCGVIHSSAHPHSPTPTRPHTCSPIHARALVLTHKLTDARTNTDCAH
jgi:hypothetical protein